TIEWLGSMAFGTALKTPDPTVFTPAVPRPLNVDALATTLQVPPPDGWGMRIERDQAWSPAPANGRQAIYRSERLVPPPPVWQLFAPRPNFTAAPGFGLVEIRHDGVNYRTVFEQKLPRMRPQNLVLRVAGLPAGSSAEPEVPA